MDKMKEIKKLCEEKQIRMIDFIMTDIDGRWNSGPITIWSAMPLPFIYSIARRLTFFGYWSNGLFSPFPIVHTFPHIVKCMMMEDWGIKVKYHHHEVGGPGQMEIEVELADMPDPHTRFPHPAEKPYRSFQ